MRLNISQFLVHVLSLLWLLQLWSDVRHFTFVYMFCRYLGNKRSSRPLHRQEEGTLQCQQERGLPSQEERALQRQEEQARGYWDRKKLSLNFFQPEI